MFDIKDYVEVKTVDEAITFLKDNPSYMVICGGTDVLIKAREGKIPEAQLVSIKEVAELNGITVHNDGTVEIGAATTFTHLIENPIIREHLPMLGEAVELVGGPQIRNMGTIGGNICNGATSADSAPMLLALNAELKIKGIMGMRIVPIREFYLGPGRVNLNNADILVSIIIRPENYRGYYGHYIKFAGRKAMDIATLGTAVILKRNGKTIEDFRLAFGVAGPTPIRCPKTEALAIGREFSKDLLLDIANRAIEECNPRTSWRATKEFRLQLIKENSKRATIAAYRKSGGEINEY